MLSRTLVLVLLLALLAPAAGPAAGARRHIPPPVHLQVRMVRGHLELDFSCWSDLFSRFFGRTSGAAAALTEAEVIAWAAEPEGVLAALMSTTIAGRKIAWQLQHVTHDPGQEVNDGMPYGTLHFAAGLEGPPEAIEVRWLDWDRLAQEIVFKVPVLVRDLDGDREFVGAELDPDERGWIWRRRRERKAQIAVLTPPAAGARGLGIPLLGASLLLLATASLLVLKGRSPRLRWTTAAALLALSTGAFAWHPARIELGGADGGPPPPAEARALFERLHRELYTAFEKTDEEAIYEVLERVVHPEILREVYEEIYESLVMRDEGGARAVVSLLRLESCKLDYASPRGVPRFDAVARWRLQGLVEHWNHRHLRTNDYEARFAVRGDGGRWRIARIELLDQERVGPDAGVFGR